MSSIIRNKYSWLAILAISLLSGCGGGGTTAVVPTYVAPTLTVIPITMPYNGSVGASGSASANTYYSYTTTATTNRISMVNLTADADPKIYTSSAFTTLNTNWSCTWHVGTTADTCTATTPVPAGTVLYIKAVSYSATGAAYTLTASNTALTNVNQGAAGAPLAIGLPYNGGVGVGGFSYYAYTATATRSLITVKNMTNDVDPVIFTTATFATVNANWTCTAWAGLSDDTCTATVAVPAGTVLYIGIQDWGGGGTFTIQ